MHVLLLRVSCLKIGRPIKLNKSRPAARRPTAHGPRPAAHGPRPAARGPLIQGHRRPFYTRFVVSAILPRMPRCASAACDCMWPAAHGPGPAARGPLIQGHRRPFYTRFVVSAILPRMPRCASAACDCMWPAAHGPRPTSRGPRPTYSRSPSSILYQICGQRYFAAHAQMCVGCMWLHVTGGPRPTAHGPRPAAHLFKVTVVHFIPDLWSALFCRACPDVRRLHVTAFDRRPTAHGPRPAAHLFKVTVVHFIPDLWSALFCRACPDVRRLHVTGIKWTTVTLNKWAAGRGPAFSKTPKNMQPLRIGGKGANIDPRLIKVFFLRFPKKRRAVIGYQKRQDKTNRHFYRLRGK